jgi:cytochrome P450
MAAGGAAVDMSDFLLHEAQAQLQLALLGAPEELMEATNAEIRAAFMGDVSQGRVGALGDAMRQLMELAKSSSTLGLPSDGCPVRGPLSRAVQTADLGPSAMYGNMLLILFAGHDTTGHTMTWLLFELARNPAIQARLHEEVDQFMKSLGGRDPTYRDLSQLDLMDKCITETLRLWPAVASGTYRRLQFDDTVIGPGGKEVTLPRGTAVNIVNWNRHRNKALWGDDADHFNPLRDFKFQEMVKVGCPMAAVNPQSHRFSPFAFAPRNCLGRNFAQMEMRLIILNLLHKFDFALAPPYDSLMGKVIGASSNAEGEFRGINRITLGPMNMESWSEHSWGKRPLNALKMFPRARQ